jgi:hypothetical protein
MSSSRATSACISSTSRWRERHGVGSSRDARNPVRVGLANENGYPHEGEMVFVDNVLNPAPGRSAPGRCCRTRTACSRPACSRACSLLGSRQRPAMLIHERAVLTDQDRKYVYVVGEDNLASAATCASAVGRWDAHRARAGLAAKDRVVVNGVRKIFFPGMPSRRSSCRWTSRNRADYELPPAAARSPPLSPKPVKIDASDFFFIDRPIFAAVLSILIFVAGLLAIPNLPVSEYPDVVPPIGAGACRLSRRESDHPVADRRRAARGSDQRRRRHDLHEVGRRVGRRDVARCDVRASAPTSIAPQVQVQNRVSQALPRLPEAVRQLGVSTVKSSPNLTMVVFTSVSPDGATTSCTCATTSC